VHKKDGDRLFIKAGMGQSLSSGATPNRTWEEVKSFNTLQNRSGNQKMSRRLIEEGGPP